MYDVSHMGHARAYLTFDILRRVVEDYFGYSVLYQMNITDIDDKIILRARRNKLVADFRSAAAARPLEEVAAEVRGHAAAFLEKRRAKAATLAEPLPASAPQREKEERETLAAEAALKAEQAGDILAGVEAAVGDLSALLVAGQDPLAEALDAAKGHEVNDPSIFDAHARRFEEEFHTDMERLGVRPADSITRVSEFVPEVVAYIERIVGRGLAYAAEGSVYFDTRAFQEAGHTYRKLVPFCGQASEAEMAEGEGALGKRKAVASSSGAAAKGPSREEEEPVRLLRPSEVPERRGEVLEALRRVLRLVKQDPEEFWGKHRPGEPFPFPELLPAMRAEQVALTAGASSSMVR